MSILRPYNIPLNESKSIFKINEQEFYYADVYMQKEGQEEDLMNEAQIRTGFVFPALLKNETPSAFDVIQETLTSALPRLASFGKDIIQQQYSVPFPGKSAFSLPDRIFMKDVNKESWMEDLTNSQKPLSEVAISKIPLTSLNTVSKLLETCTEREIPLKRALWFLKCVGVHDMRPQKAAPSIEQNVNTSKDWTKLVLTYLVDQINALGIDKNSKRQQNPTLTKEEIFRLTLKRLQYLIELCRLQYDENLLCRIDFLRQCLLLYQKANHLNQLPALICIAQTFLDEFCKSRFLARQIVVGSVNHLHKLKPMIANIPAAKPLYYHLISLVQHLFIYSPDTFVSSFVWKNCLPFRKELFTSESIAHIHISQVNQVIDAEQNVRERLFRILPSLKPKVVINPAKSIVLEVKARNLANIDSFILGHSKEELSLLLSYCIVMDNLDNAYAVAWLFALKSDRFKLQPFLFAFLENCLHECDPETIQKYRLVFRVFEEFGLFSFPSFMRYVSSKVTSKSNAKLSDNLLTFSVRNLSKSLNCERSICLSSSLVHLEDEELKKGKLLVALGLPTMFSPDCNVFLNLQEPIRNSFETCNINTTKETELLSSISALSPFLQIRIAEWLCDSIYQFIVHPLTIGINNWKTISVPGTSVLNGRQFCLIVAILEEMMDYHTLLEISVWLLGKTFDDIILRSIAYILQRHAFKFISQGQSSLIFGTIWKKYVFDQQKYYIFPSLLSSMKLFNEHSREKTDLAFLTTKKGTLKKTVDFSYLKEVTLQNMSKISLKLISDCSSVDSASSIVTQSVDILHSKFTSSSSSHFSVDLYCFSYLLLQVQQAGTFMEEALLSYLVKIFVTNPVDEKKTPNWLFELIISQIANQGVSFVSVITDIIIPLFEKSNLFSTSGKLGLSMSSKWFSVLETILLNKTSPFLPGYIYHLEILQAIETFQSTLSAPKSESSIFSLLVCFQELVTEKRNLQKPPELIHSLANFVDSMIKTGSWFQQQFSFGPIAKFTSILSEDPSKIVPRGSVMFPLISLANFSVPFPRNVDDLKGLILSAIKTLPKENSVVYVFISLEIASAFKASSEVGWESVFDSLFQVLITTPSDLPLQLICSQYANQWRDAFLAHLSVLKEHLEKLRLFFLGSAPLERKAPFADINSLEHYMSVCSSMFFAVFGSASSLLKDDSRKNLKKIALELCQLLMDSIVTFQSLSNTFDHLEIGSSLQKACDLAGNEDLKNCSHFEEVGLNDVYLVFRLFIGTVQSVIRFVIDVQEEINTTPFFQSLMLLSCCKFMKLRRFKGQLDAAFDLIVVLSDDLPKSKVKEVISWLMEKFTPLVQAEPPSRLQTLLPSSESMTLLSGLYQTSIDSNSTKEEVIPAESGNARPWEWIEHGVGVSANGNDGNPQLWNDTSISLAVIGARRVRPQQPTFQSLFEYGWRPSISVNDESAMKIDYNKPEPFVLNPEVLDMGELKKSPSASSLAESGEISNPKSSPESTESKKRPADSSLENEKRSRYQRTS